VTALLLALAGVPDEAIAGEDAQSGSVFKRLYPSFLGHRCRFERSRFV
jgi:hypothetical protein